MRKLLRKAISTGVVGFVTLLLVVPAATAAPTMMISDGKETLVIQDNGSGDLNPLEGAIVWSATIGTWTLNVTRGATKPRLGTAEQPYMRLDTFNATSEEGGELTIWFTETGFDPFHGELISSYQGNTVRLLQGSLSFETWFDAGNNPFGLGTMLLDTGPLHRGFDGEASSAVNVASAYSITEVVRIFHKGQDTSFGLFDIRDAQVPPAPVPEPSVLVFLGACLVGLGIWRTRKA